MKQDLGAFKDNINNIDEFSFSIPDSIIGNYPEGKREEAKLLVFKNGQIKDDQFSNLAHNLPTSACLVLNDTEVLKARLIFKKPPGKNIEIFCLEPAHPSLMEQALSQTTCTQWLCLIGGASKWKSGELLTKTVRAKNVAVTLTARYKSKHPDGFIIEFTWNDGLTFAEILNVMGKVPLPPYIKRAPEAPDAERYQTVFAKNLGSVAAPTAALHFTPSVFESLREKQIRPLTLTLHIGAGTFKPIKSSTIADHHMHSENFSVTDDLIHAIANATSLAAVGTTSLRTLESLYWIGIKLMSGKKELLLGQWEAYELNDRDISYIDSLHFLSDHMQKEGLKTLNCKTSLLIIPGYKFRSAEGLITNFHQPRSTLLLLIAAFVGNDWKNIYTHALNNGYRFFSYGDSSLLWRKV